MEAVYFWYLYLIGYPISVVIISALVEPTPDDYKWVAGICVVWPFFLMMALFFGLFWCLGVLLGVGVKPLINIGRKIGVKYRRG